MKHSVSCNSIWDQPDSSLDMGDPLTFFNSINLINLIEKSDLVTILNGLIHEPHGCITQGSFSISLTTNTYSKVSPEGGWQGHHTHVNTTGFSTRQTTFELGNKCDINDYPQTEKEANKTKH